MSARPMFEGRFPGWPLSVRPIVFQFQARDADDVAGWLHDVLGVTLSPAQQYCVDRAWATLRQRQIDAEGQGDDASGERERPVHADEHERSDGGPPGG